MAPLTKACVLAVACLALESSATAKQTCGQGAMLPNETAAPLKAMKKGCTSDKKRNQTWLNDTDCAGTPCVATDYQCCQDCPFLVIAVPSKVITETFVNVSKITWGNVTTALTGMNAAIIRELNKKLTGSTATVGAWMDPVGYKVAAQVCGPKDGKDNAASLTKFNSAKTDIKNEIIKAGNTHLCQSEKKCTDVLKTVTAEFVDQPPVASQKSGATAQAIPSLAFLAAAALASAGQ